MDYSKIRVLMLKHNYNNNSFSKAIGMSTPGFKASIEKGTLTVQNLESICKVFNVPISYFFENDDFLQEPDIRYRKQCKECLKKDGKIELLTKLLKDKEDYIKELYKDLGRSSPGKDGKVA